ncbi:MAG: glycerol kinase GlpK [Candidatus Zixiibacteriota bacterium]
MKYILSLDQGTTSSRAVLFDFDGKALDFAQKEFMQYYPKPGWVEHDPMEIWGSQFGVIRELFAKTDIASSEIAAIGISNQRETTILWDKKTGKPVSKAIVWQCRRSANICESLKKDDDFRSYIRENTGLLIDAYFSATKIVWLLQNIPDLRGRAENGEIAFGTVDSWLLYKLTGGKVHATDYSNASRTMLFNIKTGQWDEHILDYLEIPKSILPKVKKSAGEFGKSDKRLLGRRIPITGIAGDQQAALFGQACFEKGDAKNTYGTGCFLLLNTGEECNTISQNPDGKDSGLLTTIAWKLGDEITYALEGSVFIAGAAIQWLRDQLRIVFDAADTDYYAKQAKDNGGVYFVPAFVGLSAPYWDMQAQGMICGLSRGSNRNHIVRAALESIAYQSRDVFAAMQENSGLSLNILRVDGGASANDFLMQFQADILQNRIERPAYLESSALGAAFLAGLGAGIYKKQSEIAHIKDIDSVFDAKMPSKNAEKLYSGWKKAVERVRL